MINGLIAWTNKAFGKYNGYGLFSLAFMESSFFPIPPDFLLIAFVLANPESFLWLAFICTLGSVLGGMFGYLIGYLGEQVILEKLVAKNKIEKVHRLFEKYEAWAILIAGFTPIPYKVFTIAAGVFYVNFRIFVLMSILGRGSRFFLVAYLTKFYGEYVINLIDRIDLFLVGLVVVGVIAYYLYRKFKKK
ncbi:MAG: YqaA family protein [Candidatus Nanoarchaeia archaeon]|nr:YqaA family protein [Candidatus Nanoarchaeia archaeon]